MPLATLVISSPFVSAAACDRLATCVDRMGRSGSLRITLVTNLCLDNILSRATNVDAISQLVKSLPGAEVRFIPSLHAKVYVADVKRAIIISANLTDGGLYRNLEYGVDIDDPDVVASVRRDVEDYAALGPVVSSTALLNLAQIAHLVAAERRSVEGDPAAQQLQLTLRSLLATANEQVLRARTAGRSLTAILEDAILYLLGRGPLSTQAIHARVQQIHPDLCDDNVDRVIDGRSYGKRWKHSVRTAQSHLKERGLVQLVGRQWMLARKMN
jgi:hypothetical protein